jgi:aspartate aminotransferase
MIQPVAAFDRIGEENAFAVLARATVLAKKAATSSISASVSRTSKRPEHIVEAAIKALRDGHHGYTPANGLLQAREAVCRRTLTMTGVEVSPDSVMIMPGGKPTMYAAIRMLGEPGVDILYPDPGFPIYRSMIEHVGANPIPVPMREENGFAFSAEETLALITPQTRLLILNSPANPTGGVTPKAEIDKLVAGLAAHPQVAILSDEIYDVMTYDGETPYLAADLSGNPRPADRSQWLVQDLGDDRLAHGLVDLARQPDRLCPQARGQLLVLRQRAVPIRRHRRNRRTAGCCG